MTTSDKDLPRGDDRTYRLTIREPATGLVPNPPAIDITGYLIVFQVKKQPEAYRLKPTDPVVISKSSDDANDIEILDQATDTGACLIKLRSSDTEFLPPGTYAYSVRVQKPDGRWFTVAQGRIFLKGPATSAENLTPP